MIDQDLLHFKKQNLNRIYWVEVLLRNLSNRPDKNFEYIYNSVIFYKNYNLIVQKLRKIYIFDFYYNLIN